MVFERIKVNDLDLLIVFFTTLEPTTTELRGVVKEAADAFIDNYAEKLNYSIFDDEDFKGFSNILFDLDLINRKAKGPVILMKKKTFLQRLDKLIRRN